MLPKFLHWTCNSYELDKFRNIAIHFGNITARTRNMFCNVTDGRSVLWLWSLGNMENDPSLISDNRAAFNLRQGLGNWGYWAWSKLTSFADCTCQFELTCVCHSLSGLSHHNAASYLWRHTADIADGNRSSIILRFISSKGNCFIYTLFKDDRSDLSFGLNLF